ncbi:unnamed protein product [marine sediment metagenome]|uniref:Uncharacterized protein n=1 Tax=marine sediment metagenome TaxID=412755 RepID=X0ZFI3_9ZZZZ
MSDEGESCACERPSVMGGWRAAAISLVLAVAQVFIAFLALYDLTRIASDPASFAFDLFRFAGASFFGTFMALTGLAKYYDK